MPKAVISKYWEGFMVFLIFLNYALGSNIMGFENGLYYKVTSVPTGKFLTVDGQQFQSGANVVVKEWNGQGSQKWLALEAPLVLMNSFARSEPGQKRFYLIPTRQSFDWSTVSQNVSLTNLPETVEVLTLNAVSGNLTLEVRTHGSSSQQWIPEDAGDGRIFIRNLGNNQCVKNFDYRLTSLFQKIASFLSHRRQQGRHAPRPLGTFDCSPREIAEKWIVELA